MRQHFERFFSCFFRTNLFSLNYEMQKIFVFVLLWPLKEILKLLTANVNLELILKNK